MILKKINLNNLISRLWLYTALGKETALAFDLGHLEKVSNNFEAWFDEAKAHNFIAENLDEEDIREDAVKSSYQAYKVMKDYLLIHMPGIFLNLLVT